MKFCSLIVGLFASFAIANSASALATFEADAMSTFTLISDGGMAITYESMPEAPMVMEIGTGMASIDADMHTPVVPPAPVPASLDVPIIMESAVSGSADAPSGLGAASVMNAILVTLDNSAGSGSAVATFTFAYTGSADVEKTDGANESAVASPFFHLTGFSPSGDETLMIDEGFGDGPMPVVEWLVHPVNELMFSDTSGGIGSAGVATVTALVTVPAFSIEAFSVITDASGIAIHRSPDNAVPEPVTTALTMLSLGALGMATRRRVA